MVKKVLVLICILVSLSLNGPAFGSSYYIWDDYGGTWSDANKNGSGDSNLCWAAASSNTLTWAGWNAGYSTSSSIFDYFKSSWTNVGGWIDVGWQWWFDGTNVAQGWSSGSQVKDYGNTGNFYTTAQFTNAFHELNDFYETNKSNTLSTIASYLHSGYAVGLGIYKIGGGGHAISVWGYDYDALGNYTGLWITDSDDGVTELKHYGISLINNIWYLEGYYGTYNKWWIGIVDGLACNVTSVPEPSMILLLVSGLIGLAGLRKKLKE